jgi:hypothetical protein
MTYGEMSGRPRTERVNSDPTPSKLDNDDDDDDDDDGDNR